MTIDSSTGWLDGAVRTPSPNCDDRPVGVEPELIVVHSISLPPGDYGGPWISDFFQNRLDATAHEYFAQIQDLQVSAHALISRNGHITQYVPFHRRAWHAGVSYFAGREACNDFSIGIELEGTDESLFRSVQYWQLAELVSTLQRTYNSLHSCPIVGHSDIAPGRKTDPGTGFNWDRFRRLINVNTLA
ncbi:MAG: 1,6-anhydro-N-acetylmuramyl-L-alanine amidase AmpD [Gammaproteobacteria bacterium]|nr:1,6-anhydro-N-acetylmuramyl-L-alanine amidase AmpD [Gammaproteobacteria bacterium]